MGKVFTSEVADVTAEAIDLEYPYDFTLDDRVVNYRKPGAGEALLLLAATGRHVPPIQKLAAIVDLFATVIEPKDQDWIIQMVQNGLLGPKTLFGEHGDDGILADMLEEWSARPTKA
jgi:hypothetical protein